jgi:GNAT superfamily N-acetyltransferase
MTATKELLQASLEVGRDLLGLDSPVSEDTKARVRRTAIVPIRSLGENHRERIATHLLSLDPHDRYLRFGYVAQDTQIRKYSEGLDFARDDVFGIYDRRMRLLAFAHLAYAKADAFSDCAEFGVSVVPAARGRGYGKRLFERAAMHASNDGIKVMFIHALSENAAMLKIARQAGAHIERDGTESEAFLTLPEAGVETRLTELLEEGIGRTDYSLKLRAGQFRDLIKRISQTTTIE